AMKSIVPNRIVRPSGAVLCLFLLAGCAEESPSHVGDRPPMVRVHQPILRNVTGYEYFTGRTKAPDSLDLRAKVNGYLYRWNFDKNSTELPAKDFNFVPGQEVKRDQVLFKIDPRPYQAVYDQALAQIKLAEAQLTLAQADYARALQVQKTPG